MSVFEDMVSFLDSAYEAKELIDVARKRKKFA